MVDKPLFEDIEPDSIQLIGKLDELNQLFRQGVTATIIDIDSSVCITVGNARYYFNPVIKKEEYEGFDGETHLRTVLKYDGWERSVAPTTGEEV
jgi:hypothetical protein